MNTEIYPNLVADPSYPEKQWSTGGGLFGDGTNNDKYAVCFNEVRYTPEVFSLWGQQIHKYLTSRLSEGKVINVSMNEYGVVTFQASEAAHA